MTSKTSSRMVSSVLCKDVIWFPSSKNANYGKGIEDTIDAYIRTISAKQKGEGFPEDTNEESPDESFGGTGFTSDNVVCCAIVLLSFLIFVGVTISRARKNSGGPRGRGGGRRPDYVGTAGEVAIDVIGGLILGGSFGRRFG